jgi:hypothetical protein
MATVPTRPICTLLHGPLAQRTRPTVLPGAARAHGRLVAQRARRPERRAQVPGWARRRDGVTSRGGSAVRRGTHRRRELCGYARGGGRARRPRDYSGSPSSSDRRGRTTVLGSDVESGGDLRGRRRRRRAGIGRGGQRRRRRRRLPAGTAPVVRGFGPQAATRSDSDTVATQSASDTVARRLTSDPRCRGGAGGEVMSDSGV